MKIRLKPQARADFLAIRAWSEGQWGPGRSQEFLQGLIEALERLSEFPQMGRLREVFAPGLRSIRYKGYVIFYMLDEDAPVIVAAVHERRNHAALDFADRIDDG